MSLLSNISAYPEGLLSYTFRPWRGTVKSAAFHAPLCEYLRSTVRASAQALSQVRLADIVGDVDQNLTRPVMQVVAGTPSTPIDVGQGVEWIDHGLKGF
jgi:hypothetical protein